MAQESKNQGHIIQNETAEHAALFDAYVKLGGKRSLKKLAESTGQSLAQITKCSRSFDWQQRIKDIEQGAVAATLEQTEHEYVGNTKKLLQAKDSILKNVVKIIETMPHDIQAQRNAWHMVKVELGEPTEIAKGTVGFDGESPMDRLLNRYFGTDGKDSGK